LIPIFVLEAIINFALSIVWVRAYGVVGSAMGTVVPRVIMGALVLPWYGRRTLGIPLRAFWTSVFVRPIFALIPFTVATYAVERLAPARNLATFFGQVALTLPVAGVAVWFLCLSVSEQMSVRQLLGRLTTRPA
jgi:Na+-driven multidrug efflux pump